jgi:hypothetical protein
VIPNLRTLKNPERSSILTLILNARRVDMEMGGRSEPMINCLARLETAQ